MKTMKTILIVEDDPEYRDRVKAIVTSCASDSRLIVEESFQGVILNVINAPIRPHCAIVDMLIPRYQQPGEAGASTICGVEVLQRLVLAGVAVANILVLTDHVDNVRKLLHIPGSGLEDVSILDKQTTPAILKKIVSELIATSGSLSEAA